MLFQFHKGTIRTTRAWRNQYGQIYFNSIKVRLERARRDLEPRREADFNSIKVRLEHKYEARRVNKVYFNSIKVRLEPYRNR